MSPPASVLQILCAAALCGATGCLSIGDIGTIDGPASAPVFSPRIPGPVSSAPPAVLADLRSISAIHRLSGDELISAMSGKNRYGATASLGRFSVSEAMQAVRQATFSRLFGEPAFEEEPCVVTEIELGRLTVGKVGDRAVCRIEMHFVVKGSALGAEPVFDQWISASDDRSAWPSERRLPEGVATVLRAVVSDLFRKMAADPLLIPRLRRLAAEAAPPPAPDGRKPPRLSRPPAFADGADGSIEARFDIERGDWEYSEADLWARGRIAAHCAVRFGTTPDRVRIEFEEEPSGAEPILRYRVRGRFRRGVDVRYDHAMRAGECVVDADLLGMPEGEASRFARNQVLAEMDDRAGAVRSGAPRPSALVRFGDIRTEAGLQRFSFRLVD